MTENNNQEDQAWASVIVPLSQQYMLSLIQDVIRLLRINPMIYYSSFKKTGEHQYRMQGRNTSQVEDFDFDIGFTAELLSDGVRLVYEDALKTSTTVKIEADELGSKITITDDYSGSAKEDRQKRLDEVDKSLLAWLHAIQEYAIGWKKWSWCAPWRWYMRKVWNGMNPSARRISYMLMWVTLAEIIGFLLVFTIFWFEYDKYFPK